MFGLVWFSWMDFCLSFIFPLTKKKTVHYCCWFFSTKNSIFVCHPSMKWISKFVYWKIRFICTHTIYNWMRPKGKYSKIPTTTYTHAQIKLVHTHTHTMYDSYRIYHLMKSHISVVRIIGWRKRSHHGISDMSSMSMALKFMCARCGLIMFRYSRRLKMLVASMKTDHAHKCLLSIFTHRKNRHELER